MAMYFTLYNLLHQYIYGLETTLTADMELTLTIISTLGALFVVALPFILVWKILKFLL